MPMRTASGPIVRGDRLAAQTPLDRRGAQHRILRLRERDQERVAGRVDLESVMLLEKAADARVVRIENPLAVQPIALALAVFRDERVAQHRRADDVGEHERDDAGRWLDGQTLLSHVE